MIPDIKYFYTVFGEVYDGLEINEMDFADSVIVIPPAKLQDYQKLTHAEKTRERVSEFGWVLGKEVIAGTIHDSNFRPPRTHRDLSNEEGWDMKYDRRTMFIFGAGASAHCVTGLDKEDFYKNEMRPPVGPALFEKRFSHLYSKYKGVKQSLHFLQGLSNPDVEALFENEWKQIQQYNNQSILSRHISIQYYLQHLLRDTTTVVAEQFYAHNLYAKLAYKLQCMQSANKLKKFAFVSFNQDTILEHFLTEHFNYSLTEMDNYCSPNVAPYCLFKPHGSWNWAWEFPSNSAAHTDTANWLFDNKKNFHQIYYELLGDHISMVDWDSHGHHWSLHKHYIGKYTVNKNKLKIISGKSLDGYFPALLLPYRDKDEFTMPLKHFYAMDFYFGWVETLVIIGWKGNEASFTSELFKRAERIKRLIIVDPQPDAVKQNLAPLIDKLKPTIKTFDSFESFVSGDVESELN